MRLREFANRATRPQGCPPVTQRSPQSRFAPLGTFPGQGGRAAYSAGLAGRHTTIEPFKLDRISREVNPRGRQRGACCNHVGVALLAERPTCREEPARGLMDVLRGMANGPRRAPGGRGGISPITMGLLALLNRGEGPLGDLFRQGTAPAGNAPPVPTQASGRRQLSRLAAKWLGRSARRRSSWYTGFTYRFPVQMSNLCNRLRR